jgi:hypothetical protein
MASYNLDIREYSLDDLFNLFEIPSTTEIRKEHIRIAKQKVMMSHPDKSRLPPEYFIFYKKAFEMIVHYYETQNRTEQTVPTVSSKETELIYDPIHSSQHTHTNISSSTKTSKNFNRRFNELFEANEMIDKPDISKNEWFRQEENPFAQYSVNNAGQINQTLEQIKKQEKERAMALYRGVTPLNTRSSYGHNFYDEDEEESDGYICSDPFSKLKYDDLRKVHKDQTVFMVSENDLGNVKTYHSVDQYSREREKDRGMVKPMEKEKAEKWFQEEERRKQERIMQKQHQSELKTMENIEKNKSLMASFLRIL